MLTFLGIPTFDGHATCADPSLLPIVDEAFHRPGGPAAQMLKRLCRGCEIRGQCLEQAMANPEFGVWGGTSPRARTVAGAPSPASYLSHRTLMRRRQDLAS